MIYDYGNGVHLNAQHNISETQKEPYQFRIHDEYELFYLLEGDLELFVCGSLYIVKPGDLVVFRNSEMHIPRFKKNHPSVFSKIYFDPRIIDNLNYFENTLLNIFEKRNDGQNNLIRPKPKETILLKTLFEELDPSMIRESKNTDSLALTYFIRILCLANNIFDKNSTVITTSEYNIELKNIVKYIDMYFASDLMLHTLAKKFYISKQHLVFLFKNILGCSVHDYVTHKRLIIAKSFLRNGFSVEESCKSSGFNDYSNFIRTFKSRIGVSPGKYAKTSLI